MSAGAIPYSTSLASLPWAAAVLNLGSWPWRNVCCGVVPRRRLPQSVPTCYGTAVGALAREDGEFGLSQVEPASVLERGARRVRQIARDRLSKRRRLAFLNDHDFAVDNGDVGFVNREHLGHQSSPCRSSSSNDRADPIGLCGGAPAHYPIVKHPASSGDGEMLQRRLSARQKRVSPLHLAKTRRGEGCELIPKGRRTGRSCEPSDCPGMPLRLKPQNSASCITFRSPIIAKAPDSLRKLNQRRVDDTRVFQHRVMGVAAGLFRGGRVGSAPVRKKRPYDGLFCWPRSHDGRNSRVRLRSRRRGDSREQVGVVD